MKCCRPYVRAGWPSGPALTHSGRCPVSPNQKLSPLERAVEAEHPLVVAARPHDKIAHRHAAETMNVIGSPFTPVIPLPARDDRCPAHPSEPLYDCRACTDLADA